MEGGKITFLAVEGGATFTAMEGGKRHIPGGGGRETSHSRWRKARNAAFPAVEGGKCHITAANSVREWTVMEGSVTSFTVYEDKKRNVASVTYLLIQSERSNSSITISLPEISE